MEGQTKNSKDLFYKTSINSKKIKKKLNELRKMIQDMKDMFTKEMKLLK